MKKFQYRLEPLLKLRKQLEDQKKRAVGELLSDINKQQQQALDMADQITRQSSTLRDQFASGTVDVQWISYYQGYVTNVRRSINTKIENVKHTQQKLHGARVELAEAAKQTKILEKLKENQLNTHTAELNKQETADLDEIATGKYCRKIEGWENG
ncbi:MAG: flagellar export protein FliJ [Phycisphaerae bacterium]|nr:flagellar export protein FliJ [Phycisphaerae bacterium]